MISEAHNLLSKGFPRVLKSHIQEKNVRLLVAITSPHRENVTILQQKIEKEITAGRVEGPFESFSKTTLG